VNWIIDKSRRIPVIRLRKMSKFAVIPQKWSVGAAAYDLHSCINFHLMPGKRYLIPTGLQLLEIPNNTYLRIAPRSSMSLKYVSICSGVIDWDYKGELKILACNYGEYPYLIQEGERIAQLICEKIENPLIIDETGSDFQITDTGRGSSGFGSTNDT
jgi:dUTP pyrophosphatase